MAKIREMSTDEMVKEEQQQREAVWKLRLQLTTGQLQDPQKVHRARRDLARLLTIRRERELAAQARTKRGRRR